MGGMRDSKNGNTLHHILRALGEISMFTAPVDPLRIVKPVAHPRATKPYST